MNEIDPDQYRTLKPQQARFVDAYLVFGEVPPAADFVEVDRSTGWRWLQLPQVQDELAARMQERARRVQAALFQREAAAFAAIDALLASPDEKVQLRTATWVLDHALRLGKDRVPAKTLSEMQLDELEARAMAEISGPQDLHGDAR